MGIHLKQTDRLNTSTLSAKTVCVSYSLWERIHAVLVPLLRRHEAGHSRKRSRPELRPSMVINGSGSFECASGVGASLRMLNLQIV